MHLQVCCVRRAALAHTMPPLTRRCVSPVPWVNGLTPMPPCVSAVPPLALFSTRLLSNALHVLPTNTVLAMPLTTAPHALMASSAVLVLPNAQTVPMLLKLFCPLLLTLACNNATLVPSTVCLPPPTALAAVHVSLDTIWLL